jgi:2-amino-4-hydroxy-6-hydroxymethyldihydropteridine diphosphokinase
VIKLDTSENPVKIVYLGIGSNLGNKRLNIENTKSKIQSKNIKILKCSSYFITESWPDKRKPKFINIVLKVKTTHSATQLLKICHLIEKSLGRKRSKKNAPRTCDIDIIDYNQQVIDLKNINLILPHPSLSKRNFVLLPLFQIDKSWKHPKTKIKIVKLLSLLSIADLRSIKQT